MHYNVIFDVTQSGFRNWGELVIGMVATASTIGFLFYKLRTGFGSLLKEIPTMLFLCFFSLFTIFGFVLNYQNYLKLRSALQQSKCSVTEGTVTDFHHVQWHRHTDEAFVVNGNEFVYWAGSSQNGFNQSGVIRTGLQVRVYYFGKHPDIARLEIAQ
jgi:hypothetical protein